MAAQYRDLMAWHPDLHLVRAITGHRQAAAPSVAAVQYRRTAATLGRFTVIYVFRLLNSFTRKFFCIATLGMISWRSKAEQERRVQRAMIRAGRR